MNEIRPVEAVPPVEGLSSTGSVPNQGVGSVVSTPNESPQAPHAGAAQAAGATSGSGQCYRTDQQVIVAHSGPHAPQNQRQWQNIPETMRQLRQWCFSPPGTKAPHDAKTGKPASVTNWITWSSFDEACAAARYTGGQIGFVLHASDPFCIIDLDVKDDTAPEHLERFRRTVQVFDSYSEISVGGLGAHVICIGTLPNNEGKRRDGIEVYNASRYMVTTGRRFSGYEVQPRQELLDALYEQIQNGRAGAGHSVPLVEVEPTRTDEAVKTSLLAHQKAQRIIALANDNWQSLGYPSRSEAAFALVSYIANSTQSNEQVRRIFRTTLISQSKHGQDYYLNRALRLVRAEQVARMNAIQTLAILKPPAP